MDGFARFLDDGRICLSNNAAEPVLRPLALGRRSWLFAGSDRGGMRAAAIYTLIGTAKLNDIAPQAWPADVLARIAETPRAPAPTRALALESRTAARPRCLKRSPPRRLTIPIYDSGYNRYAAKRDLRVHLEANKMADLDFVRDLQDADLTGTEWFSGLQRFWELNHHDIPKAPGVYLLQARGTRFPYPLGTNSVYYIGQSKNLRSRLLGHLRYALEARDDRQRTVYRPRHEYAAAFGTHYYYVYTWKGLTPKALEEALLARFAEKHRSFPVANSSGAWRRIR